MTQHSPPGAAPAILLLHGMSLNPSIFPEFGALTLRPDLTEIANSLHATGGRKYGTGLNGFVAALDEYLTRHPEWDRSQRVVMGHSFGAMLALQWWLKHGGTGPAALDRLVLVSTSPGPLFDSLSLALLPGSGFRAPLKPLMTLWNLRSITAATKLLLTGSFSSRTVDFQHLRRKSDLAIDLAGWRNTPWRAMRTFRNALEGFDVTGRLSEIDVHVTVVHGLRDPLISPAVAAGLAARLPQAALHLLPDAGHGLPLTHGSYLRELLEA